ncbi:MAG: response regulator [Verrucomicrobiae bacterium]|nr:response regulator [Verrucomicrobiae bacterium]
MEKKFDKQAGLITVKEAANYLRIPVPTVYYLVQRGQLPAIQIGGRWRIKKDALDVQILGKEAVPEPPPAPIPVPVVQAAAPVIPSSSRGGESQILIVDDESMIHELIRDVLSEENCGIDSALNGKDALGLIGAKKFNLLFLDMVLPDMSGDQIYEYAAKSQPNLLIVVITAFVDNKILDRVLASGPITILPKPIDIHQLRHLTRVLLKLPVGNPNLIEN